MTRADRFLRPVKGLALLSVAIGLAAAFVGLIGGFSMAGAVIQGDLRGDVFRLAFLFLPFAATCLFVFGAMRETTQPAVATAIYGSVAALIVGQLLLPALS